MRNNSQSEKFILSEDDKDLVITDGSYCHLEIRIDYDDVDHTQVMKEAKRLLKLMNDNRDAIRKE